MGPIQLEFGYFEVRNSSQFLGMVGNQLSSRWFCHVVAGMAIPGEKGVSDDDLCQSLSYEAYVILASLSACFAVDCLGTV